MGVDGDGDGDDFFSLPSSEKRLRRDLVTVAVNAHVNDDDQGGPLF